MSDVPDWSWLEDFVEHEMDWGDTDDAYQDSGDVWTDQWTRLTCGTDLEGDQDSTLSTCMPDHHANTIVPHLPFLAPFDTTNTYAWHKQDDNGPHATHGGADTDHALRPFTLLDDIFSVQGSIVPIPNGMTESDTRLPNQSRIHTSQRQLQPRPPQQSNTSTDNDGDFDFTSGCKPLVDDSGPIRHQKTRREKKSYDTEFFCTVPDCRNKGPFKRRYELDRHLLTHGQTRFSCPVVSCNKKGSNGIPREDKFKDHMRNAHRDEDVVCACPVTGCNLEEVELDLLREHCLAGHGYLPNTPEVETLGRYAEELRQCRMPKCRKPRWLEPDQIPGQQGHLMTHDEAERPAHRTDAESKGYDSLTGNIICPICDYRSTSTLEFVDHLEDEHVLSETHRGFGAAIRSAEGDRISVDRYRFKRMDELRVSWHEHRKASFACEFCFHQGDTGNHAGLLKPSQGLLPYRRQILQLLPEFRYHPVFDDIRMIPPNVGASRAGVV